MNKFLTGLLLLTVAIPRLLFAQELTNPLENFGDHSDVIDTREHYTKKVKIVDGEIFFLKLNRDPYANAIVKTDLNFHPIWEYQLPAETFIKGELVFDDNSILFFSKQHSSNDIKINRLNKKSGRLISEELFYQQNSTTVFIDDMQNSKRVYACKFNEDPDDMLNLKNRGSLNLSYYIFNKGNTDITAGNFSLTTRFFALYNYELVDNIIYLLGFEVNDSKEKTAMAIYSYDIESKKLDKNVLGAIDDKLDVEFVASAFSKQSITIGTFVKDGRDKTFRLTNYNYKTQKITTHELEVEKADKEDQFAIYTKDSDAIAVYLQRGVGNVYTARINTETGKQVGEANLPLKAKLSWPRIRMPLFLKDGKIMVNIEVAAVYGDYQRSSLATKEVYYYLLDTNGSLLKADKIKKESYYMGSGVAKDYWYFLSFTCLETDAGVYYFYKPDKAPVRYTLIDHAGNKIKSDIPLTKSFHYLKKDMITDMGNGSYLFFGETEKWNMDGFLKGEVIKLY
jgi:hypothetical protein